MQVEQNEEVMNALSLASWTLKNLETTCMLLPFVILNIKQMDLLIQHYIIKVFILRTSISLQKLIKEIHHVQTFFPLINNKT
jgi:hypothetical protein